MDGTAPTCRWGSPFDPAGHALVLASFIMTTAPTREPTAPISTSQKPKPRLVAAGLLAIRNATASTIAKNVSASSSEFQPKPRSPPGGYCTWANRTNATRTPATAAKDGRRVPPGKSPEPHALVLSLKFPNSTL